MTHSSTFPSTRFGNNIFSNSTPLNYSPKTSCIHCPNLKTHPKCLSQKPLASSFISNQNLIFSSTSSRYTGISLSTSGGGSSGSGDEDNRALETVLKLYAAIKSRNISELSDVIGEECRCVCNFISMFQPLMGKKQVLEFFSKLMKYLGSNIQFVVQPILHDGMNVGIAWRLEWEKTHVPLGKGFSFYMCHVYQGKVLIKNVQMFMEPIVRIEPLRLKVLGLMMTMMDKIGGEGDFKLKAKKAIYVLLALSIMAASLFFLKLL